MREPLPSTRLERGLVPCSRAPQRLHRSSGRAVLLLLASLLAGLTLACATKGPGEVACTTSGGRIGVDVYHRAETERAARLATQVERLAADLAQAEEALVLAESGLRGSHTRADAVSSLAEARIELERAAGLAPWRPAEIAEARAKLDEADRQIDAGHFGAALFFVYRGRRISDNLEAEAEKVYATPDARFVRGGRVNLRAGPASDEPILSVLSGGTPVFPESERKSWVLVRTAGGAVGWIHTSLLSR